MKTKILAGIAAAAVVAGGTMALTESPASAHAPGTCAILHLEIGFQGQPLLLDLCPLG